MLIRIEQGKGGKYLCDVFAAALGQPARLLTSGSAGAVGCFPGLSPASRSASALVGGPAGQFLCNA